MADKQKEKKKREVKKMEISEFKISVATLKAYFDSKVTAVSNNADLIAIFDVASKSKNFFLFPRINGDGDYKAYIDKWISMYVAAKQRSSLTQQAKPKSAVSDPSIMKIVKTARGLTDAQTADMQLAHNLFMSAENVQGYLLEEYIASVVTAHGFLYSAGNLLRSVDFCSKDGTVLLQIKNKSNTENSSSSDIRKGTNIEKWYRLGTKIKAGVKIPDYKWDKLNEMVSAYSGKSSLLSEDGYTTFIWNIVSKNQTIITDK